MIRVYCADIRPLFAQELFDEKIRLVSPQRKEKILRYRNHKDRCRSLAAGLLVREGITEAGFDWDQVVVRTGKYGKPELSLQLREHSGRAEVYSAEQPAQSGTFHYNISHAGNYAVAAFAGQPVGVDIEEKYRIRNSDILSRKILTQNENIYWQQYCAGLSGDESLTQEHMHKKLQSELARIWTRKEAYCKAVGKGLALDFSTVETMEETEELFFLTEPFEDDMWLSVCVLGERKKNLQQSGTCKKNKHCTMIWKMIR